MKLKDNTLQELYDTIINGTFTFSPNTESPVDKAFKECDERLQKDIDIWKRSNEILLSANTDLASIKRKLDKEIEGLKEHILDNNKIIANVTSERDDLQIRAHNAEDEVENLKKKLKTLQDRNDVLEKSNGTLLGANIDLCSENRDLKNRVKWLEKDSDEAKSSVQYFKASRDDLQSRVNHAEEEVEDLKKELTATRKDCYELYEESKQISELRRENAAMHELIDNKNEENRALKGNIDYLKKRLNSLYGINSDKYIQRLQLQDGAREIGYEQGQADLWNMLIEVGDATTSELCGCFPDVCEVEDLFEWDLEDFLDAYKTWQEKKETERLDHMRDYLARFCQGRLCHNCPLYTDEFMCGRAKGFPGIPDEELERYYEKARDYNKRTWHGDATAEKIEAPVSCDIPIKDLASWECAIEATVKINKDLLEKVCGVNPDDK